MDGPLVYINKIYIVLLYGIETLCWPKCVCCVLCTLIEIALRRTELKWLCIQALRDTLQHGEAVHQRDGPKWRHAAQAGYRLERTTRGGGQCRYFARRIWRQCRPYEQLELFECALEFTPILCWAQKMHKKWSNLVRLSLLLTYFAYKKREKKLFRRDWISFSLTSVPSFWLCSEAFICFSLFLKMQWCTEAQLQHVGFKIRYSDLVQCVV